MAEAVTGTRRLAKLKEMVWAPPSTGILVRVTNLGLGFVLMTLIVAVGATNTGNNGLYTLVSLFLAALVVSGIVSRRNVERLTATLDGPPELFAGQPARFRLSLKNEGRFDRRALLVKVSGSSAPLLFARIERGEEAERGLDLLFPKRGRQKVDSLLVYSGYPIGLFRKGRRHPVGLERIVYPAPSLSHHPRPDPRDSDNGDPRSRRRGRGHEIRNLREAHAGDDPRDVHWPQTARQGRFIIKERAADDGRDALVILPTYRPTGSGKAFDEAFERAVSESAGLALHLLLRGNRVGLLLGPHLIPPASGVGHRRALLVSLALVEPSAEPTALPPLPPGITVYTVAASLDRPAAA